MRAAAVDLDAVAKQSVVRRNILFLAICLAWTAMIAFSVYNEWRLNEEAGLNMAAHQARALLDKDIAYRAWNSGHGGVYVKTTEKTPPNPYLKTPFRNQTTTDGLKLTMINPAYMTRQIHEMQAESSDILGRLTSLNPLNPINAPTPWQESALGFLQAEGGEYLRVAEVQGAPYLRLMKPLYVKESCLKCHAEQGYRLGDMRGGISVETPLADLFAVLAEQGESDLLVQAAIWLAGIIGMFLGYLWTAQSDEKRRVAEEGLKQQKHFTETVVNSIPEALCIINTEDRTIAWANDAFAAEAGLTRDQAAGHVCHEFFPPLDERCETFSGPCPLRDETPRGAKHRIEQTRVDASGRKVYIEVVLYPFLVENGRVKQFVHVTRDVTADKEAEQAIVEAKERAEEASRAKSEFLANLSHEIRTPMNGIIGMTELALDTPLTPAQREYLDMVKGSAESLFVLLNDILDFSRIEAGRLNVEYTPFHLASALENAIRALALQAESKGLEVHLDLSPALPPFLMGDAARLRQVVLNLVGNAVKFTTEGEILVKAQAVNQTSDGLTVRIDVSDTGIGISEEKQAVIFNAFTQADGSSTREYGGAGLGLTIASRLVEMMGGRIWLESAPGEGSVFSFTFRTAAAEGVEPAAAAPVDLRGLSGLQALIVDDNPTARRLLQDMLTAWGLTVEAAESGQQALALVEQRVDASEAFDLILVDGQMPNMDGFTLAAELTRRFGRTSAPVIMLTSSTNLADAEQQKQAGVFGCLAKPVRREELAALMQSAVRRPEAPAALAPEVGPLPAAEPPLRILAAEDNRINQRFIELLLTRRGHDVTLVGDGRQAVEAWEKNDYDLILMDVQMPVMDGIEAVAAIRGRERETGRARTPVAAMTAHAMRGDRERFLESGMDDYLSKPVNQDKLAAVLRKFTPGEPDGAFDLEVILNRIENDRQLLKEMIDIFLEELPGRLQAIDRALAQGDAKALEQAAHSLKGSLGYFAAPRASRAVEALAAAARDGSPAGAEEACAAVKAAVAELAEALTAERNAAEAPLD